MYLVRPSFSRCTSDDVILHIVKQAKQRCAVDVLREQSRSPSCCYYNNCIPKTQELDSNIEPIRKTKLRSINHLLYLDIDCVVITFLDLEKERHTTISHHNSKHCKSFIE